MFSLVLASLLLLLHFTNLINAIDVTVGPDNAFHPNVVHGNPGELVSFHFAGSGFSASEATARLSDPCNTEGGFDSGVEGQGAEFSIVISTYNSIYVFSQNQCTQGFVMIVNPGPNDSVARYQSVASNGAIQGQQSTSSSPSPSSPKSTSTPSTKSSTMSQTSSTMRQQQQSTAAPSSSSSSTSLMSMITTAIEMTSSFSTTPAPIATPASASTDSALPSAVKGGFTLLLFLFTLFLLAL